MTEGCHVADCHKQWLSRESDGGEGREGFPKRQCRGRGRRSERRCCITHFVGECRCSIDKIGLNPAWKLWVNPLAKTEMGSKLQNMISWLILHLLAYQRASPASA